MPPRIPLFQCLRAQNAPASAPVVRAFSTTPTQHASTGAQRRKHRDPYAIAQAKARKAANLSRQEVLKTERASSLGDPIRGVETPYLRSFDTGTSEPARPSNTDPPPTTPSSRSATQKDEHLNFFLTKSELEQGTERSRWLLSPTESEPVARSEEEEEEENPDSALGDETTAEFDRAQLQEEQDRASEALRRISSLSLGSSKDRLRVNKQRCIADFGRHNTDAALPPKPPGAHPAPPTLPKERAGPDTGSSEVQVAILTAKIRTLADFVQTRGRTDRVNQRNLRLLVHRRQKLLQYVRRKERGGPRWQHLIETLGLTEGTWKGEITLGRPT